MFFPPIEELATTDIVSVTEEAYLSEALRLMAERQVRDIVIQKKAGGYGLLTAPDMVHLRFSLPDLEVAVGQVDCRPLPSIPKGHNILNVLDTLDGSQGYAVVVDETDVLYGIVSNTDILSSLDPQLMLQRQHLRDLLHRHKFKKMPHDTPLGNVLVQLADSDDAVILIDQGRGVGIITTHDAILLLQADIPLIDPAHMHMSTPLHTVSNDLTVGEAAATLREMHFKRLVVQDTATGEIVGVITQKDLIGVAYSRWADLMRHHALELQEIISVLERKTAKLEQIAATDPLTGAANRVRFEVLLNAEQMRHERAPDIPYSIILFDLDLFKQINDSWGHNQGDLVLKEVVRLTRRQLRNLDTLARWGGEEFVVLLPQTGLNEARVVAEKLCQRLAQTQFDQVGEVTASFGVATGRLGELGQTLIGRADAALYRAKSQGRSRVEIELDTPTAT